MKHGISKTRPRLAALLLSAVMLPACAAPNSDNGMTASRLSFKNLDTNGDGYLSMEEFIASGEDDLAFKASDIDGDKRLDPDEFKKYLNKETRDQPASGQ
jgi:Ca2+-binding EF-hand superfamily protein